jgi:FAD-dependent urate hydroxylase
MNVIVAGGGIAGPVTAMALQRAGIDAIVREAYDAPPDQSGLFLNLATNGLDALRAIDVDIARHADAWPIPHLAFFNGAGKSLGRITNGISLPDGTASICIRRDTLQRALAKEATDRGLDVTYGKRLVNVDDRGDGIEARYADGTTERADLLIAADGIHSHTRAILNPNGPTPSYTGMIGLGGYSRLPDLEPTRDEQRFVFGRRAFFGYLVRGDRQVWWFANLAHPDTTTRDLAAVPSQDWQRRLRTVFADDMSLISRIIDATDGPIGVYPIHDLPSVATWAGGGVCLIGDAAHATSPSAGQGASIACEDAVVIAQCLRDCHDVPSAFERYEELRRRRVERVVAYSRKRGSNKTAGPVARVLRDLMMPIVLKRLTKPDAHAWLYGHHIDWNRAVSP